MPVVMHGRVRVLVIVMQGMVRVLVRTAAAMVLAIAGPGLFLAPANVAHAQTATAVEYYYSAWDHYFVTADAAEIAFLDGGGFNGNWVRTGETFTVGARPDAGAVETCRFFSTTFAPRSSHFYTPFATECASLKTGVDWQFESIAFYLHLADASGACPAGTTPLYRLYNNGLGGAPNHRYTRNAATVAQMHGRGWTSEGNGPDATFACLPGGTAVAARGRWTGTASNGDAIVAAILDDGTYYIAYSAPGSENGTGVIQGTASFASGQVVTSNARNFPIATAAETNTFPSAATVTGTYTAQSTLDLALTIRGVPRTVTAGYVPAQPASLAAIAGAYSGISGHADGRRLATFAVTATGALTGGNDTCSFHGTVTPRAALDVFDWTLSSTGGACIFGTGPIFGVMMYDAVKRQLRGFAPYEFRTDLYYVIGTRQ
jgi:hypothetical protein